MPTRTRSQSSSNKTSDAHNTLHMTRPRSSKKGRRRVRTVPGAELHVKRLLDLPTELLVDILRVLPYQQLVCLRRLCKRFQEIIDNTLILQYIIERSAAGYNPDVLHGMGVVDALNAFRRTQRAYRHPKLHAGETIGLSCGSLRAIEWSIDRPTIIGDMAIFCNIDDSVLGVLNLRPNVSEAQRFRSLQFDIVVDDFFVCVPQDLIIIAEGGQLHFRSLSTGDVHHKVLAVRGNDIPILESEFSLARIAWKSISVWKEWMLVRFSNFLDGWLSKNLQILFHWPTGKAIAKWRDTEACGSACLVDGFAIIPCMQSISDNSRTYENKALAGLRFFYTNTRKKYTELGADAGTESEAETATDTDSDSDSDSDTEAGIESSVARSFLSAPPAVMVYRLPSSLEDSALELTPLAEYRFPTELGRVSVLSDMKETLALRAVDAGWPGTDRSCDNSAHFLELTVLREPIRLFVPTSTLLTGALRKQDSQPGELAVIPWEAWGPQYARFVHRDEPKRSIHRLSGSHGKRIVFDSGILDFNPYDVARNIYSQPRSRVRNLRQTTDDNTLHSEGAATLQTDPTMLGFDNWDGMSTSTPYRSSKLHLPKAPNGHRGPLTIIEEEDHPKIVEFVYNGEHDLCGLRYHSFSE